MNVRNKSNHYEIRWGAFKGGITAFFFDSGKSNAITIGVTKMEVD